MARSTCSGRWLSSSSGGPLCARTVPAGLRRTRPDRTTYSERRRRPREEVQRWQPAAAGTPRTPMPRAASVSSRAATASCSSRVSLSRSRRGATAVKEGGGGGGSVVAPSPVFPAAIPVTSTVHRRRDHRRDLHGTGTTENDEESRAQPSRGRVPAGINDRRSVLHLEG